MEFCRIPCRNIAKKIAIIAIIAIFELRRGRAIQEKDPGPGRNSNIAIIANFLAIFRNSNITINAIFLLYSVIQL